MFLDWAKTHSIHSGNSTRKALLLSVCPVTNLCWVVYLFRATQLAWPLWAPLKEIPCPLTSIWLSPWQVLAGTGGRKRETFHFPARGYFIPWCFLLGPCAPPRTTAGTDEGEARSWVWNSRGHSVSALCKGVAGTRK